MKYPLNLPIEYDNQRYGYYYTEPLENFLSLPISEAEVFALDVNRKAMRTFVLSRLSNLELTKENFKPDGKFDPDEYLKGSVTAFKGREDYEVVIEFDVWATDLIRGRKWHPSQDFTELPNGTSRLSLRLNNIEEMEQWILSWGLYATVVRQMELVKRLGQTIAGLGQRYEC